MESGERGRTPSHVPCLVSRHSEALSAPPCVATLPPHPQALPACSRASRWRMYSAICCTSSASAALARRFRSASWALPRATSSSSSRAAALRPSSRCGKGGAQDAKHEASTNTTGFLRRLQIEPALVNAWQQVLSDEHVNRPGILRLH